MNTRCIKAVVSGKVQGVFYRGTTIQKAKSLQLTGWVKNTEHGTVELVACGDADAVKELTEWLWEGPPAAQVTNVEWKEIAIERFEEFNVIR